jgi:hypothetical protein
MFQPRQGIAGNIGPSAQQLLHMGFQQVEQQRLLVRGIGIERPCLHPNGRCDLAHGYGSKALPREQAAGMGADQGAGDIGTGTLGAGHGVF